MKKFLLHFLLFSCILYALAWCIDTCVSRKMASLSSSPFANWNDIYRQQLNSDVLIMGSSRAYVQFNPRILDSILHVNSYNLGCNGRPVDAQLVKYRIYRQKQHTKPRLIIYELYPGSMDTSNRYEKIQFLPHLRDPRLWAATHTMEQFSLADGFIPCWRFLNYKKDILAILNGKSYFCQPENTLYKGFLDYDKSWDGSALAKIDTIYYQKDPQIIKQFEQFLDECERDSIRVVFVMAPYYIGATRKMHDAEGMRRMFHQLAAPHDIPVLDYTHDILCYDTAYFYNATHLNRTGATMFTTQLAHDIDSLGFAPSSPHTP